MICVSCNAISIFCKDAITKQPVLPVPDCDCAITSLPSKIGLIAFCWIGLGFSNPYE